MSSQTIITGKTAAEVPSPARPYPERPKFAVPAPSGPSSPGVRWLQGLAYAAGSIVLVTIVAWLVVPPIVRGQLEASFTEGLDRRVTIESVAFDPFSLRFTLHNLAVADSAGTEPLFALDALVVDLSAASARHRAPVLDVLKLIRPRVSLARDRDGRYSIQDLIDQALALSSKAPPRFSLNNVEVEDGSITFNDGITGRRHVVSALNVSIPFLSSLPDQAGARFNARAVGTLDGSRFALNGSTTVFGEHRDATADIVLDRLSLPAYAVYLPFKLRYGLAGGELTAHLAIAFADGKPDERRLEMRGEASIDKLAIHRHDGSTLAASQRVAVAVERLDFIGHDARIARVSIDAPTIDVKRLADGTLEWAGPLVELPTGPSTSKPSSAAPGEASWQWQIGKLAVDRGTVALADETSAFRSTLVDVAIDASNVTTRPGEKTHVKLGFVSSDRIASFAGEADVEPGASAATGRFTLSKFSLGSLAPYYRSALDVDVQKGSFDFASAFALDAAGRLRFTEGEAAIADLIVAIPGDRTPLWHIPRLTAHAVDVDVSGRRVTAEEILGEGAALRLARKQDGTLEISSFLRAGEQHGPSSDGSGWVLFARNVALDRMAIDFDDRATEPPVKLAVRELTVAATDVTNAPGMKSTVALHAQIGKQGRLSFAGLLAMDPLRANGQLDASGLALAPVQSYLEPRLNAVVTDGTLAAKGLVEVEAPANAPVRATWRGDVAVSDFAMLDEAVPGELARWKRFLLEGVDISTGPFRASMARIGLEDFYVRAVVSADGTLNLARVVRPKSNSKPGTGTPRYQGNGPATQRALPISIGRIEFERGNVSFTDFFIKPSYSVNVTDITGKVSAMSGEQGGNVAILARLDRTAPVEVQGHIHPFAKELSLDIAAKARDVELSPLTPYSVKYAGYGIQKGKLAFEVRYQVENRKLSAENHLVLDQLTFGEHVDSPTATTLPVLRTAALLKDPNGVIDIQLPISGSLDDPQFSLGGLMTRQIVGLLTKAATAPFALLPTAFGRGEELSTLTFAEGSTAIAPDAQERIDILAKALTDRPTLKLEIGGRADPVADREALRHAAVETAIKRAKMRSLAKDGATTVAIDQIDIDAGERGRWLEEAYREAPLPGRSRNALGMLEDVPPAEMEAVLFENATADDEALRLLASARARVVRDAIAALGVAGDRLFLVAPQIRAEPDAASRTLSRVDLSLD